MVSTAPKSRKLWMLLTHVRVSLRLFPDFVVVVMSEIAI